MDFLRVLRWVFSPISPNLQFLMMNTPTAFCIWEFHSKKCSRSLIHSFFWSFVVWITALMKTGIYTHANARLDTSECHRLWNRGGGNAKILVMEMIFECFFQNQKVQHLKWTRLRLGVVSDNQKESESSSEAPVDWFLWSIARQMLLMMGVDQGVCP